MTIMCVCVCVSVCDRAHLTITTALRVRQHAMTTTSAISWLKETYASVSRHFTHFSSCRLLVSCYSSTHLDHKAFGALHGSSERRLIHGTESRRVPRTLEHRREKKSNDFQERWKIVGTTSNQNAVTSSGREEETTSDQNAVISSSSNKRASW
jgi:hypothetical protein